MNIGIYFFIAVVLLVMILIVDLYQVNRIGKNVKNEDLNLDRYYELKWRINTMITGFIIVAAVLTYVGYDLKNEVENKVQEYQEQVKQVDSLIARQSSELRSLDSIKQQIRSDYLIYGKQVESVGRRIRMVQSENERLSQVYVIPDLSFPITDSVKIFYYKDLITNRNEHLPKFNNPPILNIMTNERGKDDIFISKNGGDFFEVKRVVGVEIWGMIDTYAIVKGPTEKFDIWMSIR